MLPGMNSVRVTRVLLAIALAAAGTLSLGACRTGPDGTGQPARDSGSVLGVTMVPEAQRRPVGEIRGKTLDGGELDVADHRGEVVVLNIWASWCSPCRAEMPHLVATAEETRGQGVRFVGIDTSDSRRNALAFEKKHDANYPSLFDPTGRVILSGFPKGTVPPRAVPSTVVVDRKGRIAARALGQVSRKELRSMIDPVVAEG
jgi:thiol-disulfide isomerase/thioredoxin